MAGSDPQPVGFIGVFGLLWHREGQSLHCTGRL
jgi:hypothetical protein